MKQEDQFTLELAKILSQAYSPKAIDIAHSIVCNSRSASHSATKTKAQSRKKEIKKKKSKELLK